MRKPAGRIAVAAIVAAAVYVTFEFTFFDSQGEAKPDFSVQSVILVGLIVAALMELVLAVVAEVRHLRERRRDRDWSITTGGGPRA